MSTVLAPPLHSAWKGGTALWLPLLLGGAGLLAYFYPALEFMVATWHQVEEYSYGWFVPAISAFLIWQRSDRLRAGPLAGSWWGLALLLAALALGLLGRLSAVRLISQYGFVVGVFGLALATVGWRGLRVVAVPLAMLLFMIPLPQFLLRELSHTLQLVSSQLGVALIRLFDISVFLEGNVIDLGSYKLQVVEACSGLRYLFPLLVLGCLVAAFLKAPLWQRLLLIGSTVPLTIVINSLRIGLIGVSVEHWGVAMAEGLLHDLEGGAMFAVCLALLVLEVMVLARWSGRRLSDVLAIELPAAVPRHASPPPQPRSKVGAAAALLLVSAATVALLTPAAQHTAPARSGFGEFPLQLEGGWAGRGERIAPEVLAILALDDYLLANYQRDAVTPPVNVYAAYYASQSGGESTHSPRTCIPGDGWAILRIDEVAVPGAGTPLRVNRVLIAKGEQRQLVYYWFRQRGRSLTGEFQVKWHILLDGLLHKRSDGALLRLVTPLAKHEELAGAEARLAGFARTLEPRLAAFVPD